MNTMRTRLAEVKKEVLAVELLRAVQDEMNGGGLKAQIRQQELLRDLRALGVSEDEAIDMIAAKVFSPRRPCS